MVDGGLALNGLGAGDGLVVVGIIGVGDVLVNVTGLNLDGTVPALARL